MSCFLPPCEIYLVPQAKWAARPLGVKRASDHGLDGGAVGVSKPLPHRPREGREFGQGRRHLGRAQFEEEGDEHRLTCSAIGLELARYIVEGIC